MSLGQHMGRLVFHARFQAAVCDNVKPERIAIEVRGLPGIANEEADMINTAERKKIRFHFNKRLIYTQLQAELWTKDFTAHGSAIPNRLTRFSNSCLRNGIEGAMNSWSCI